MTMLEELARAAFDAHFHPDDRANGIADEKWAEWADDREHARLIANALLPIITREIDRAKAEGWNAAVEKAAGIVSRGRCTNGSHRECEVVIQYGKAAAQVIQAWKDKHDDA